MDLVSIVITINHLTLSRDKTVISHDHQGDHLLEIRSNRTAFVLSQGGIIEHMTVRGGHTLAGTVRMTVIMINAFLCHEAVFRESVPSDFLAAWQRIASPYEDTYLLPPIWYRCTSTGYPISIPSSRKRISKRPSGPWRCGKSSMPSRSLPREGSCRSSSFVRP
ncbi:MAG: hypothetical protein FD153_1237 [Rhodospirillaceae bacterium]|nr:MAG: hypothetical protein FD153_1237 [Rhodospirillaceae bacterium]